MNSPSTNIEAPVETEQLPSAPAENSRQPRRAHFNNPEVVTQSWYVAAYSRQIPVGQVRSFDLLNRRIALYRDQSGKVHALDAHCSHLGADLGLGKVRGDEVECAFHHWRYGPDGRCRFALHHATVPRRRVRSYPTLERWGIIWLFNGPEPTFALPDAPAEAHCRSLCLPPQHIHCHPHLVIGNGLDMNHFDALHDFEYTASCRLTVEEGYRVRVDLQGRPRSPWLRWLVGSTRQDIRASFTTVGSSLAWVEVEQPYPFYVLFAGRVHNDPATPATPLNRRAQGGCDTQVVFLFPKGLGPRSVQALALMYILLYADRRILNSLAFRPGFTEADSALRSFAAVVDAMDLW